MGKIIKKQKQKQLTKTRESTAERVKPPLVRHPLTLTPRYGQFALSLGKESPYIFSKFKLLIQTLYMAPQYPY